MYKFKATVNMPISKNVNFHAVEVEVMANNGIDAKVMFETMYGRILIGPIQVHKNTGRVYG